MLHADKVCVLRRVIVIAEHCMQCTTNTFFHVKGLKFRQRNWMNVEGWIRVVEQLAAAADSSLVRVLVCITRGPWFVTSNFLSPYFNASAFSFDWCAGMLE